MRSLKDRAANASKINGVPSSELVDRYFLCRLLARVFHADHEGWILKGGQALLVRWPRARYSTDIDLFRTGQDATIDGAVDALIAATSIDMDDHLQFSHHDTSGETNAGQPIRKVRFKVMFGLKQLSVGTTPLADAFISPLLREQPPAGAWRFDQLTWGNG